MCPTSFTPLRVVTLGNANDKAFCACSYLVSGKRKEDGTLELYSILIMAKTKVAPLKQKLTIPRLEMLAALLNVRLSDYVLKGLQLPNLPHYHLSD